jgi:DNA modification methylase
MSLTILEGDSAKELAGLPAESVQLIVTSPPYDNLRKYGGHTWNFEGTARQLYRVLCDGGVCCWNVGDQVIDGGESLTSMRQALYFVDQVGFRMHDTQIYEKLNFSNPDVIRYHQLWEYVFVLSKGRPRTFNPIKDRPNICAGTTVLGRNTKRERDGSRTERPKRIYADFGMRGNIWRGKTRGQEEMCEELPHSAMMPRWLAHDLIPSWSNEGDTIVDPFAGSGTTAQESIRLKRHAIAIEIDPESIELIKQRTDEVQPDLFPAPL